MARKITGSRGKNTIRLNTVPSHLGRSNAFVRGGTSAERRETIRRVERSEALRGLYSAGTQRNANPFTAMSDAYFASGLGAPSTSPRPRTRTNRPRRNGR